MEVGTEAWPNTEKENVSFSYIRRYTCGYVLSSHTYKVSDVYYLQQEDGPIFHELTGAFSRPFMQRWDRLYLEN